jgi:hypothetical protein
MSDTNENLFRDLLHIVEKGAASLRLNLHAGVLTVLHSEGTVLLEGPLPPGGWQRIIDAILAVAPEAKGPMRQFNDERIRRS